jgi:putative nucleotidyltransferase with HDIG domain
MTAVDVVNNDDRITQFVEDHQCLKAMPESSIRILQLLTNSNFRMEQLIKLIKQDAAIAARIITVVNSAAYARSNRITQLDRATVYLGVNTVKEIVAATTVEALCKPGVIGKYTTRDLWHHSVGVAVLSREFALRSKAVDPELAFLAGILHDIGLLLATQSELETSEEVFLDAEDQKIHFTEVEKGYFGFNHCELGGQLAAAWKFPEEVSAVINWHHSPHDAPGKFRQLCTHVFIADTLCAKAAVGFPLTCALQKADDGALKTAGLARDDADEVVANLKILIRLHMS